MNRFAIPLAAIALFISALYSVRIGAITLAGALALFAIPGFRTRRPLERAVQILLIVSLVTVALALPRR